MENKRYYKNLDIIRIISCIAVFLYHLNILKGGFLAVCIFFVLTGYLSFISAYNKIDFSIKDYYISKLKNIYLPFILVVFISIFVISFIPSINWVNLKPETTSTILGYNNFWQLNASLDYFARHVDSPFMHFWYIAILLQFELLFPLIFIGIRKFHERHSKKTILVILILLSLIGTSYFVYSSFSNNIMFVYYNTLTRVFSIFYGVTLGYITCYFKKLIPSKLIKYKNYIFYSYIVLIIVSFFLVDSSSKYYFIYMILVSLISCRLIEYATIEEGIKLNIFDKIVKSLSKVSYEIYLIQYPVIFLFQELGFTQDYMIVFIIVITVMLSYIMHFALNNKNKSFGVTMVRVATLSIIILISIIGFIKYLVTPDHTEELKELESQLAKNQELMEERQKEYALKLKEEENKWNSELESIDEQELKLGEIITNLKVIGIGDSVMLGAIRELYGVFPNGYFDAKTSRTDYVANGILLDLSRRGILGDPIVFALGTNGQCGSRCRVNINNTCGDRKKFWVTTTNRKMSYINNQLKEEAKSDKNMYIIDWEAESSGHNEYFVSDRIHLTYSGKVAYSKFIYNEIYKVYQEELKNKKEEMIKSRDEKEKSKLYFYGNDILLNSFEYMKKDFEDSNFEIDDYTYESLYNKLSNDINTNKLSNNYVLIFDNNFRISKSEYKKIIDLLEGKKIYVLFINSKYNLKYKDVNIIDFDVSDNLSVDGVHLTSEGSEKFALKIKEYFE